MEWADPLGSMTVLSNVITSPSNRKKVIDFYCLSQYAIVVKGKFHPQIFWKGCAFFTLLHCFTVWIFNSKLLH